MKNSFKVLLGIMFLVGTGAAVADDYHHDDHAVIVVPVKPHHRRHHHYHHPVVRSGVEVKVGVGH